jgi:hypothetical protein
LKVNCVDSNSANWFFLSEVMFNAPKPITYPIYTYDSSNIPMATSTLYRDAYNSKLMNGAIDYITTTASSMQQGDWVWFDNAGTAYDNVIIYVDYGKIKEFSNLSLNYATNNVTTATSKVYAPSQVNLSFSNDGITYGTPVSLTGWYQGTNIVAQGVTDAKTFAPRTGRYVKIHLVRNTSNIRCLRFGEIILSNRTQMTYLYDEINGCPLWGNYKTETGNDPAQTGSIANLNFGDLANGFIPTDYDKYSEADWVEWAPDQDPSWPSYGIVTFDLKSAKKVKNVAIVYSAGAYRMPAPGGLEAAFSTDGTTFSTMTDTGAVFNNNDGDMNSPRIYNTVFALPETQARYVKLKINCRDNDGGNWIFIAEVKFNVFTADLDDNGAVNFEDLATMSDQWLQTGSGLSADIAGNDNKVNFQDFAAFALQWMY